MSLGWLLMIIDQSVQVLEIARVFNGLGFGMAYSAFPLYIGEIAMPKIRGALTALATIGVPFGQFLASILNSKLSIQLCAIIYLIICAVLIVIFIILPDSPHNLMKRNKKESAMEAIAWYRSNQGVKAEFEAIEQFVLMNGKSTFSDKLRQFKNPPIIKATIHIVILFTFMQLSGINSILFYMEDILTAAGIDVDMFEPSDMVILVNACGIFAASLAVPLIDRCGRRFLLVSSAFGLTVSLIGMMSHFILIKDSVDSSNLQWLPIASTILFVCVYYSGFMTVPNTVLGEYFPADIKCIAALIASMVGGAMSFLSSRTFNPMVKLIDYPYVFLYHAVCAFVIIPYGLIFFLETKGKTLQEIQDKLSRK